MPDPVVVAPPESTIVGPPLAIAADPVLPETPAEEEGPRLVPLAALHEERGKAKDAREKATAAEAKVAESLVRVRDLEQQLLRQAAPPAAPVAAAAPEPELDDTQAELLARTLELYDATTGQPDLVKARKVGGMVTRLATKATEKAVQPMAAANAKDLSDRLKARAAAVKDPSGRAVDAAALDFMWQAVPPEIAADPNVAAVLTYAAAGYERFHGKPTAAVPPPVVVSERVGGHDPAIQSLSEIEAAFLEKTGRDPKQYLKGLRGYKPGQNNILE